MKTTKDLKTSAEILTKRNSVIIAINKICRNEDIHEFYVGSLEPFNSVRTQTSQTFLCLDRDSILLALNSLKTELENQLIQEGYTIDD